MSDAPPTPPSTGLYSDGLHGDPTPAEPGDRRSLVLAVTGLGTSLLIAVLSILPAPFAIGGPGPTFDTLSEVDGVPLVEIAGAPTYDASGELRLTTVSVARGSAAPFSLGRVLRGWLDESNYVMPEEEVFGNPDEEEVFEERSAQAWVSSQESATVAALEALGHPVPAELRVAEIIPSSAANGVLEVNDVIVEVEGNEVPTFAAMADILSELPAGDPVTVGYVRDGSLAEASFDTLDDGSGGALMGLGIDPGFELPIDVSVSIDTVGGPSAGLMFSLAIMDMLTEEDELAEAQVAGTGTINAAGEVGSIGGIVMKMHGAVAAGADYFLAPAGNCDEVIGNVPPGLDVFSVNNLDEAYATIVGIGSGETDGLQSCRAP